MPVDLLTLVTVDVGNGTPPYEQLRSQLAGLITGGRLVEGDRLPSVRTLAAGLGLAPGTVARGYAELEADGLAEGRGRGGTVVTGQHGAPTEARTRTAANRLAAIAREDGVDDERVLALVHAALTR